MTRVKPVTLAQVMQRLDDIETLLRRVLAMQPVLITPAPPPKRRKK